MWLFGPVSSFPYEFLSCLAGSARLAALTRGDEAEEQSGEERHGSPQTGEDGLVDPDAFDRDWKMKPKGHEVATAHA